MGRRAWFFEINSTDKDIVNQKWIEKCNQDLEKQRRYTLKIMSDANLEKPGTYDIKAIMANNEEFAELIEETAMYNESPISFDDYKFEWKSIDAFSKGSLKLKILKAHKKWTPAFAVIFKEQTIIGGWVSS